MNFKSSALFQVEKGCKRCKGAESVEEFGAEWFWTVCNGLQPCNKTSKDCECQKLVNDTVAQTQLRRMYIHTIKNATSSDAGNLLHRAGFALNVADVERVTVDYGDALSLMRDLRGMGEANALLARHRAPMTRSTLMAAAQAYHDLFARPDGRIPASFDIIFLIGWAPHESQQQPLKPGSATINLGDALKMMKDRLNDPPKKD